MCELFRVMLGEAYASINYTMMYYSQAKNRTHMPFNFNFITYLNKTSSAVDIKNTISLWMDNMPKGQWANWVVSIPINIHILLSNTIYESTTCKIKIAFRWVIMTILE